MDPGHVCSRIRAHTSVASFPDPAKGGAGLVQELTHCCRGPGACRIPPTICKSNRVGGEKTGLGTSGSAAPQLVLESE